VAEEREIVDETEKQKILINEDSKNSKPELEKHTDIYEG